MIIYCVFYIFLIHNYFVFNVIIHNTLFPVKFSFLQNLYNVWAKKRYIMILLSAVLLQLLKPVILERFPYYVKLKRILIVVQLSKFIFGKLYHTVCSDESHTFSRIITIKLDYGTLCTSKCHKFENNSKHNPRYRVKRIAVFCNPSQRVAILCNCILNSLSW